MKLFKLPLKLSKKQKKKLQILRTIEYIFFFLTFVSFGTGLIIWAWEPSLKDNHTNNEKIAICFWTTTALILLWGILGFIREFNYTKERKAGKTYLQLAQIVLYTLAIGWVFLFMGIWFRDDKDDDGKKETAITGFVSIGGVTSVFYIMYKLYDYYL